MKSGLADAREFGATGKGSSSFTDAGTGAGGKIDVDGVFLYNPWADAMLVGDLVAFQAVADPGRHRLMQGTGHVLYARGFPAVDSARRRSAWWRPGRPDQSPAW